MWRRLTVHPETPCEAVTSLEVAVRRGGKGLEMRFRAVGDLDRLILPPLREGERRDELWRSTCFEAFLRRPGEDGYLEFNLAPSGDWAAYAFAGYRAGMRAATMGAPTIEVRRAGGEFALVATLPMDLAGPVQLALTAVIEEAGGRISYWALRHAPGRPDFHHPDGFVLDLPA